MLHNGHLITNGLEVITAFCADVIGFLGLAIMLYGALKGAWLFLKYSFIENGLLQQIRIELGKYLALGLEFLVGRDIMLSIVEPSWDQLGKLGAIILLRTIVSLHLSWELKEVKEELEEEEFVEDFAQKMGAKAAARKKKK